MELLLNTAWLLVAIVAFLVWRPTARPDRLQQIRRGSLFAALALACALVLLFPVMSVTDDLHAEQVAMEDSSRSVIKARNLLHRGALRTDPAPFAACPATPHDAAAAWIASAGIVAPLDGPFCCFTLISAPEGRSPPVHR